nr:hypothetical protein [Candidatus Sigynarchaeota archaeon]
NCITVRSAIYGAMAVFLVVPFVCIPVHEIFSGKLTLAGYQVLFWVLALFFICWHCAVLGTMLKPVGVLSHILFTCIALCAIEILLFVFFFTVFPVFVGSDFAEFMVVWI